MQAARDRILAACRTNGVAFLQGCNADNVIERIDEGVRVIAGHSETAAIKGRAHQKAEVAGVIRVVAFARWASAWQPSLGDRVCGLRRTDSPKCLKSHDAAFQKQLDFLFKNDTTKGGFALRTGETTWSER